MAASPGNKRETTREGRGLSSQQLFLAHSRHLSPQKETGVPCLEGELHHGASPAHVHHGY